MKSVHQYKYLYHHAVRVSCILHLLLFHFGHTPQHTLAARAASCGLVANPVIATFFRQRAYCCGAKTSTWYSIRTYRFHAYRVNLCLLSGGILFFYVLQAVLLLPLRCILPVVYSITATGALVYMIPLMVNCYQY